jgi:hypothetical protein
MAAPASCGVAVPSIVISAPSAAVTVPPSACSATEAEVELMGA